MNRLISFTTANSLQLRLNATPPQTMNDAEDGVRSQCVSLSFSRRSSGSCPSHRLEHPASMSAPAKAIIALDTKDPCTLCVLLRKMSKERKSDIRRLLPSWNNEHSNPATLLFSCNCLAPWIPCCAAIFSCKKAVLAFLVNGADVRHSCLTNEAS